MSYGNYSYDFEDPQEEWRSKYGKSQTEQNKKSDLVMSTSQVEETFLNEVDKPTIKSMSAVESESATFDVHKSRSGSPYSNTGPLTSTPKRIISPIQDARQIKSPTQDARQTKDAESGLKPQNLTNQFTRDSGISSPTNQGSAFESPAANKGVPPVKPKPQKTPTPVSSPRKMMLEGSQKNGDSTEKQGSKDDGMKSKRGKTNTSGRVMYLDDNCVLHQVEDEKEIVDLFKKSSSTHYSKSVHETLQRMSTMPIDRLHHFATSGQHLGYLQKNDLFFDVVVYVGNQIFKAHRVALSCFSKYFADSFVASAGKSKHPLEIKLNGITTNAFKIFMDYVYTGVLDTRPEVIGELAIASEFLEISDLREKTVDFLSAITPEQALIVIETGNIPQNSEIFRTAYDTVMEHFSECYDTNAFNHLSLENLCLVLRDDRLVVFTEMDVFWAGLKWIAFQMKERSHHLNKVMECVRFPYLTQAEIFKCLETTDLLRTSEKCKEILIHANWIISSEDRNKIDLLNLPKPPKRLCFRSGHVTDSTDTFVSVTEDLSISLPELREAFSCEVYGDYEPDKEPETKKAITDEVEGKSPSQFFTADIVAIGGFQVDSSSGHTEKQMQRYSIKAEQWRYYGELPAPRHYHAVALLGGKIYLAGGANPKRTVMMRKEIATSTVFQYSPEQKYWKLCAAMGSCRMYFRLISLYGMLYAIAGMDDRREILCTVECYNPKTNGWVYVSSMHWPRMGFSACACDGKIYVAGGHGQSVGKKSALPVLQSMESFDPRSNQWTSLADLRVPRCFATMVSVQSTLYLCGGASRSFGGYNNKDSELSSVGLIETYDVKKNAWEYKTEMTVPRHHHGVAVIGTKIYLVGGMSTANKKTLKSVECLDTKTLSWDNSIQDLPLPAKWITCVGLPVGLNKLD